MRVFTDEVQTSGDSGRQDFGTGAHGYCPGDVVFVFNGLGTGTPYRVYYSFC